MTKVYDKSGVILLACMAVLIVFAAQLRAITDEVRHAVLNGHWHELVQSIDLVSEQVEAFIELDDDWDTYDYERDMRILVELLDKRPGVFCALYNDEGGALSRHDDSNNIALPLENEMFKAAIAYYSQGEVPIEIFNASEGTYKPAHCYFRWIPVGDYEHKFLMTVAINDEVLSADPTTRLVNWCVGMLVAAGITMTISGLLIVLRPRQKGAVSDV